MARLRTKISIAFLIPIALVVVVWLGAGLWLRFWGAGWLSHTLSEKMGQPVTISKVTTNFLNSIAIHSIRSQGEINFKLERMVVAIRPWEWLKPVPSLQRPLYIGMASGFITIPSIHSDKKSSHPKLNIPAIPFRLQLYNIDVASRYEGKDVVVTRIKGALDSTQNKIEAALQGQVRGVGPLKASGGLFQKEQTEWSAHIESPSVNLNALLTLADIKLPKGKFSGNAALIFEATGNWPETNFKNAAWKATVEPRNLGWLVSNKNEPVGLAGTVTISPQEINSPDFVIDNHYHVSGQIKSPFNKASVEASFKASEAPLERLQYFFEEAGGLELLNGTLTLSGNVNGPLTAPETTGNFETDPSYGPAHFPPIKGEFGWGALDKKIAAAFAGGMVTGRQGADNALLIQAKDLSISEIGKANNWSNIKGRLNSAVRIQQQNNTTAVAGDFTLGDLSWGRTKRATPMKGHIFIQPTALTITTEDHTLLTKLTINPQWTRLNEFKLDFGEGAEISAHGLAQKDSAQFNFSIEGKNIPPDLWPPLVTRYPSISGAMDVSGTVSGPSSTPNYKFTTVFKNIRLLESGQTWNGSADLSWSDQRFEMNDIRIDGGYEGKVAFSKAGGGTWTSNLTLREADPRLFFEIFKSSLATGGQISGSGDLTYVNDSLLGESTASWKNGHIGEFAFDEFAIEAALLKNQFNFQNVTLIQAEKAARGQGRLIPKPDRYQYDFDLQVQQWGLPKLSFDGEINLKGEITKKDWGVNGVLSSSLLLLNGQTLENFKVAFENNPQVLSADGEAAGQLDFDFLLQKKSQKINGRVFGEKIDLSKWLSQAFPDMPVDDIPSGNLRLDARATGTKDRPFVVLKAKSDDLKWRQEPLRAEILMKMDSSTMTIQAAKLDLVKGGTVFTSGVIPWKDPQNTLLEGAGQDLNLQSVFHLMGWPVQWEGRTNAGFKLTGRGAARTVVITFDGKHEGFAPFSDPGNLSGTAIGRDREWDISGVRVDSGNGYLKLKPGSAIFLERNKTGRMRLVADVRNMKSGLLTFFGGVETTGSWTQPEMSEGALPVSPTVEIEIFARSLWINQFVLDGNVTHLSVHEKHLKFSPIFGSEQQLSGELDLSELPRIHADKIRLEENGAEKFFIDGEIGRQKWDFELNAKGFESDIVRGLLDTTLPLSGPMDIEMKGTGSLAEPVIDAQIRWYDGKAGPIPIDQLTGRLRLEEGIITVSEIEAVKKKGFQLNGSVVMGTTLLPEDKAISPKIELRLTKGNLAFLESISPEWKKPRGDFEGELKMGEKKGRWQVDGYLKANGLSFASTPYFPSMKKGELDMVFMDNVLTLRKARAQFDRGTLESGGSIQFSDGAPLSYDLYFKTASEHGVAFRVPQLAIPPGPVLGRFTLLKKKLAGVSRGEAEIDLTLQGKGDAPLMAGTVRLENGSFTFPPQPGVSAGGPTTIGRTARDFIRTMEWDVNLIAGKRTQYENELVIASIDGNLHFTGPTTDLKVNGKIHTEQGSIVYVGNEFKIVEADLEIVPAPSSFSDTGQSQTLVYLKATAEKEVFYTDNTGNGVSDTVIMEVDRSLIGEIQPRFRSKNNPGLASEKALQLALGIPLNESLEGDFPGQDPANRNAAKGQDVDTMLRAGLVQLLDSSFASPLARYLARRTGLIDRLSFTYGGATEQPTPGEDQISEAQATASAGQNQWLKNLKGTRVKLGRELSSRLFADYSFKVDEYQNEVDFRHEIELAYRLHLNLFIRATSELDSERALGRAPERRAVLENRWRFGLPKRKKPESGATKFPTGDIEARTPLTTPQKQLKDN